MNKKSISKNGQNNLSLTRTARTLFFFVSIFASSIVTFTSSNLIFGEAITNRWILFSALLLATIIAWVIGYKSKTSFKRIATLILSAVLIIFAGFMTYYERGMASNSTLFYALPLLVVATLKNRHLLLATAGLSAGTYALASVKYFNDFFNEGYKVQLWGNIVLYAGTIFTVAWLIMILTNLRKDSE